MGKQQQKQDPVKSLYEATKNAYDLGSEEHFRQEMSKPEARDAFYNTVSKDFDLGPRDYFESVFVKKKETSGTSSNVRTDDIGAFLQELSGLSQSSKPIEQKRSGTKVLLSKNSKVSKEDRFTDLDKRIPLLTNDLNLRVAEATSLADRLLAEIEEGEAVFNEQPTQELADDLNKKIALYNSRISEVESLVGEAVPQLEALSEERERLKPKEKMDKNPLTQFKNALEMTGQNIAGSSTAGLADAFGVAEFFPDGFSPEMRIRTYNRVRNAQKEKSAELGRELTREEELEISKSIFDEGREEARDAINPIQSSLLEFAKERSDAGAKLSEKTLDRISEVESPLDVLLYLQNSATELVPQIGLSIATRGGSSVAQETGEVYLSSIEKLVELFSNREAPEIENVLKTKFNLSEEDAKTISADFAGRQLTIGDIVNNNLDDPATGLAFGAFAGALDFLGAKGIADDIGKKALGDDILERAVHASADVLNASSFEGVTEFAQTGIEQIGSDIGAKASLEEAFENSFGAEAVEARNEAFVKGLAGTSVISTTGKSAKALAGRKKKSKLQINPVPKKKEPLKAEEESIVTIIDSEETTGDNSSGATQDKGDEPITKEGDSLESPSLSTPESAKQNLEPSEVPSQPEATIKVDNSRILTGEKGKRQTIMRDSEEAGDVLEDSQIDSKDKFSNDNVNAYSAELVNEHGSEEVLSLLEKNKNKDFDTGITPVMRVGLALEVLSRTPFEDKATRVRAGKLIAEEGSDGGRVLNQLANQKKKFAYEVTMAEVAIEESNREKAGLIDIEDKSKKASKVAKQIQKEAKKEVSENTELSESIEQIVEKEVQKRLAQEKRTAKRVASRKRKEDRQVKAKNKRADLKEQLKNLRKGGQDPTTPQAQAVPLPFTQEEAVIIGQIALTHLDEKVVANVEELTTNVKNDLEEVFGKMTPEQEEEIKSIVAKKQKRFATTILKKAGDIQNITKAVNEFISNEVEGTQQALSKRLQESEKIPKKEADVLAEIAFNELQTRADQKVNAIVDKIKKSPLKVIKEALSVANINEAVKKAIDGKTKVSKEAVEKLLTSEYNLKPTIAKGLAERITNIANTELAKRLEITRNNIVQSLENEGLKSARAITGKGIKETVGDFFSGKLPAESLSPTAMSDQLQSELGLSKESADNIASQASEAIKERVATSANTELKKLFSGTSLKGFDAGKIIDAGAFAPEQIQSLIESEVGIVNIDQDLFNNLLNLAKQLDDIDSGNFYVRSKAIFESALASLKNEKQKRSLIIFFVEAFKTMLLSAPSTLVRAGTGIVATVVADGIAKGISNKNFRVALRDKKTWQSAINSIKNKPVDILNTGMGAEFNPFRDMNLDKKLIPDLGKEFNSIMDDRVGKFAPFVKGAFTPFSFMWNLSSIVSRMLPVVDMPFIASFSEANAYAIQLEKMLGEESFRRSEALEESNTNNLSKIQKQVRKEFMDEWKTSQKTGKVEEGGFLAQLYESLALTDQQLQDAEDQAVAEVNKLLENPILANLPSSGLFKKKGASSMRDAMIKDRSLEILRSQRRSETQRMAVEQAKTTGLTNQTNGLLGAVYNIFTKTSLSEDQTLGRKLVNASINLTFPIVRIGLNYANYASDYVPVLGASGEILRVASGNRLHTGVVLENTKTLTEDQKNGIEKRIKDGFWANDTFGALGLTARERSTAERNELYTKQVYGAMVATLLFAGIFEWDEEEEEITLQEDPLIEVIGMGWKKNADGRWEYERTAQMDAGADRFVWRINIGDKPTPWMTFLDKPEGLILASYARISDEIRAREANRGNLEVVLGENEEGLPFIEDSEFSDKLAPIDALTLPIGGIGNFALGASYSQGFRNIFNIGEGIVDGDFEKAGEASGRVVSTPIKKIMWPSLIKSLYENTAKMPAGMSEKQADGFFETIYRDLPIVEDILLKNKKDIFGYDVPETGNLANTLGQYTLMGLSKDIQDIREHRLREKDGKPIYPEWKKVFDKGLNPQTRWDFSETTDLKTFTIGGIKLKNVDKFEDWLEEEASATFKKTFNENWESMEEASPLVAQYMLNQIYNKSKASALAKLKTAVTKDPKIMEVQEKIKKRLNEIVEPPSAVDISTP